MDFFGEEDILSENQKRTYSVISLSSKGELFQIKKEDFKNFVLSDESSKDKILSRLE